jgi:hypothetical protein
MWRLCGGYVEGILVFRVIGGYVEAMWRLCGGYVEAMWRVYWVFWYLGRV